MLPVQVALVSNTRRTAPADLAHVAAALSKQAARDLAPLWAITATVDAFPSLRSVPAGYWPIVIVDHVEGAAGFHLDRNGRPYALVEYSDSWSLTASHEALEMLVDPFGRRTAAGRSPESGQGQVEFLVEACDPCGRSARLRLHDQRRADSDPVQAFPGHGQMKPEQLEIERLKREVNKLKAERDILKKAAAFFAREAT